MSDRTETGWSGRNPSKDALRDEIWSLLKRQGIAPTEPFGHIPNFVGADRAAERLAGLPIWQQAQVIKSIPVLRKLRDRGRHVT